MKQYVRSAINYTLEDKAALDDLRKFMKALNTKYTDVYNGWGLHTGVKALPLWYSDTKKLCYPDYKYTEEEVAEVKQKAEEYIQEKGYPFVITMEKNDIGGLHTYGYILRIKPTSVPVKSSASVRNRQYSLDRVADELLRCYNGPQYRGARIPKAEPGCINAINLPDNCRLKWLQVEDVDGQLEVEYTTQEPFSGSEGEQVVEEIANALEYITRCEVEVGEDIEEGDIPVVVEVICRDGRDYGYVIMDMVIRDFQ